MSMATTNSTGWGSTTGLRNNVTLQQLNGFGMRNISTLGTSGGVLMDLYFKLGTFVGHRWRVVKPPAM